MATRMNESSKTAEIWSEHEGVYNLGNGFCIFIKDGVLYLPVHTISAPAVLAKHKRLIMLRWDGASPMVFMRAADVIAAWPHVERQVRNTATALGLAL